MTLTESQAALFELLELPDPPDMHRGHVRTQDGKPERYALVPQLIRAYTQHVVVNRETAP